MTTQPRPIPIRPAPMPAARYFERAGYVAALASLGHGDLADTCRQTFPEDACVLKIVQRSAVTPGSTTGVGWADELAQTAYTDFVSTLPASAASTIIARGLGFDLGRSSTAVVPSRATGPVAIPWVGENEPIPVRAGSVMASVLTPKKFALLSVFSRELARRANGEAVVAQLLREDAALTLDTAYFATSAGSDTAHAGLLYGLSALPAAYPGLYGGDGIKQDLATLAGAVAGVSEADVVVVASPKLAAIARFLVPELRGAVIGSAAVPDGRVIAVDAASIAHVFDSAPVIDASIVATVHMDTVPEQISTPGSPATVAAPVRSTFQTDSIALRVMAYVAFAARRTGAVAYIDNANWGTP